MTSEPLIRALNVYEHLLEPWTRNAEFSIYVVGMAAAVAVPCAVLGCFLVLRGKALLGDAISHALLAGLAGAYLITGSRSAGPMIVGAVVAGLATVVLVEVIHRYTRVKEDAGIAVVFSTLFALGVVLVTRFTEGIDLDAGCVLYGEVEMSWLRPERVRVMVAVALAVLAGVAVFYKELKVTSFDPGLAIAMGIPAGLVHYALMTAVSITVVSGMEATGAILVVAMLIVPGATAYLLTDRLSRMLVIAAVVGFACALLGFHVGLWLDCSIAGAMAVVSGVLFTAALLASPRHGLVMRAVRRSQLTARIARENLLRAVYSLGPQPSAVASVPALSERMRIMPTELGRTVRRLRREGWVEPAGSGVGSTAVRLTDKGVNMAKRMVRAHRLWETYLVNQVGVAQDHAHPDAETVEHLLGDKLLDRLDDLLGHPDQDPHGANIPRKPEAVIIGVQTCLAHLREGDLARIMGLEPDASPELAEAIGRLGLPLGADVHVQARGADGSWSVLLPSGEHRTMTHEMADGLRVELRRPSMA